MLHLGANNSLDRTIECAESMRDLGVIVDSGLTLPSMLIMLLLKHMLVFVLFLSMLQMSGTLIC